MKAGSRAELPGTTGGLISASFAAGRLNDLFAGRLGESSRQQGRRVIGGWIKRQGSRLGPASGLRVLAQTGAVPVLEALGFEVDIPAGLAPGRTAVVAARGSSRPVPVLVVPWGEPMDRHWSDIARQASRAGSAWVFCFNGRSLRLCDVTHVWMRAHLEFDLEAVCLSPAAFAVFWGLLRPDALAGLARQAIDESARHGVAVCASLRDGVREALRLFVQAFVSAGRPRRQFAAHGWDRLATVDEALTVIYRVLFLLFAESRGLVPTWHPVYRSSYTIEALRDQAATPGRAAGLWEALQALSRLAHTGCAAGSLRVTPFNGRLFAPARAPLADGLRLDDNVVGQALLALTTHTGPSGREPISFRDLGVEQLGAVYESVLDYEPHIVPPEKGSRSVSRGLGSPGSPSASLRAGSLAGGEGRRSVSWSVELVAQRGRRKASGTFYTPQSMTDELIRHTLGPLVADRSADQILELRVLDPAMGSGAFLVSACRYLAGAYEDALVRDGGRLAADVTDAERAGYRRLVARRCLYGVDLNPMAVQVARLSLWLATLAADRPLTFLDHHLAVGDSLVGASLDDMARQPPGTCGARRPPAALPLFDVPDAGPEIGRVLPVRLRLENVADDTAGAVHDKERVVASLASSAAPLASLKRAANLWCACWFWDPRSGTAPGLREHGDLAAAILRGRSTLPPRAVDARLDAVDRIAATRRFFHWTLEFPEVFFGPDGGPLPNPGFDAVVGNPPWEMIRADSGPADEREVQRTLAGEMTRFARAAGIYTACGRGHANQYQLFVERSLRLVRRGGRVGLVVPWGLAADHGCAELRRLLFDRCDTDRLIGFDNAAGIFPIHRGVRFLLLTTTAGSRTRRTRCRFGARGPADLAALAVRSRRGRVRGSAFVITPALLRRLSGSGMAVPHVRSRRDLRLAERLVGQFPALSDSSGWGAVFGRELNATDDGHAFSPARGLIPVIDGRHVDPFAVRVNESGRWIADPAWLQSTALWRSVTRPRLAYRDVAAATNRLTLIAAILPARTAAVHTLMCLRTPLALDQQRLLCSLLNSFVANYLVRMRVTTHLGTTTVEQLPVPRPDMASPEAGAIVRLVRRLERDPALDGSVYIELQARAARLYGLTAADLGLVLETFPLVASGIRAAVAGVFAELEGQPARSILAARRTYP